MILLVSVGFTAIDVSLCGETSPSQSVFTFAAFVVGVVQIAVPVLTAGAVPKTAFVTGAGAPVTLWAKPIGWNPPSPFGIAPRAAPPSASPSSARHRGDQEKTREGASNTH